MEKNRMEQQNECDIIADLLPIYLDGATQEETNGFIEEHLANCEICKKNYEWMSGSVIEILNENNKKLKKKKKYKSRMFKKVKWKMLLYGYLFLLISIWLYCVLDFMFFF